MINTYTEDGYPINIPSTFHGYQINGFIGQGGTSIVCLVEEQSTNERYSAKIISKRDVESRNMLQLIEKEIEVMKKLNHPNIVHLKDSFTIQNNMHEEFIVIVMDYYENGNLLEYVTGHGFASEKQKKKIIKGFLLAVKYLHNNGISHGDIKAENILLSKDFSPKLCDFGYSRTSTIAGDESKNGTLYYAPPELFFQGEFDTLKADIWSVGILLYSLSELQFPFKNGDHDSIIQQIITGNLEMRPGMNQKLQKIVNICTQINPEKRPCIDDLVQI
ncbi:hypothetical protein M9Y10_002030 [Tritrichomonas musculus]|uniref:Protein kinase domain-containing protein n=1 Tax=Tritrichomonas musculus TaxID=1915356 RepID=A0ABR2L8N2_9EUKA